MVLRRSSADRVGCVPGEAAPDCQNASEIRGSLTTPEVTSDRAPRWCADILLVRASEKMDCMGVLAGDQGSVNFTSLLPRCCCSLPLLITKQTCSLHCRCQQSSGHRADMQVQRRSRTPLQSAEFENQPHSPPMTFFLASLPLQAVHFKYK